ncbi:MAG: M56 family metallopeptidase [Pirellulaceae bacterium]|nr:M56 family metallopeptidase [Pirellulaceae bacterium]
MITVQTYFLLLLIQVTAISVVALAMSFVVRQSAVMRHTIALTGIAIVLMSPLVTWLLPLRWHALMTVSITSGSDSLFKPSAAPTLADVETPTGQDRLPAFDGSARHGARLEPSSSALPMLSDQWLVRSDTNTAGVTSTEQSPQKNDGASIPSDKTKLARTNTEEQSDQLATETRDRFRDSSLGSWTLFGLVCFLGVWFGGAIIRAIRLLSRRRQFYVAVKPLRQLPTEALSASMQHRLRTTLGVRELPPIWTSQSIPSPVVWGVLRPVVVLPEALLRELSEQDLTSVLIHEGAHIVRRDHWNHVLQQIAGIVWWFHPGVLMLNQVLARSREEVCDNYVLRHASPADFARTLLELTERGGSVRPALSLLGLFGRQWSLETRVTELLNPGRNMMLKTELRWTTLFVSVMVACCVIVGGVSAVQVKPPASPLAEPTAANSSADQVNVEDEPPFASPKDASVAIGGQDDKVDDTLKVDVRFLTLVEQDMNKAYNLMDLYSITTSFPTLSQDSKLAEEKESGSPLTTTAWSNQTIRYPVTFGAMSENTAYQIILMAKGNQRSNVFTAPHLKLKVGQDGTISDATSQEFLTGFDVTEDEPALATPIKTSIDIGTTMKIKVERTDDGQFILSGTIDRADLKGVTNSTVRAGVARGREIQIPEIAYQKVCFNRQLRPKEVLMIDTGIVYTKAVVAEAKHRGLDFFTRWSAPAATQDTSSFIMIRIE